MRALSWRSVAAVGGLLGLVAVVAVAAAGHAPGGGESRPRAHAPELLVDYLSTIVAVFIVPAGLAVFFAAVFIGRGQRAKRRSGGGSRSLVVTVLVVAAVLIAATQGVRFDWLNRGDPAQKGAKSGNVASGKDKKKPSTTPPESERYQPQFRWLPVFVVGSLIVGIGAAMAVFAVRRRRELLRDTPIVLALSDVLAETLDDLRDELDPRKAVIRAYSRMERTLAALGLPRRESEAPLEYLTRVLDAVQASAHSARRLTQLFQRARFSTHEIDAGMKEDAIEALSGLRAELEVSR
jgi:membrane protease YdiL (CAAX protease family)